MLGNQLVLLSLYSITVKPVWLQWELLLYDVMHVCSICTSVQLLVITKELSVYCASVQFTVFHVELQIAVGRNFAAVLYVSILLPLSV
jgi:hypothetical protein